MRVPRIKESAGGYYHVLSRVVDRRMALNDSEKERFRKLMRRTETFSGVRILTHSVLDNHFHILIHVPACRAVSDSEFCERITALYDKSEVKNIMQQLAELREDGRDEAAELVKAPYVARMYELSEFCKTLKQRFTQSFNKRRERKGTLWEERFKSILLQGSEGALSTVAAYIDLNAVRAGIVADPRDYRFSGYGEAVGGSRVAPEYVRGLPDIAGAGFVCSVSGPQDGLAALCRCLKHSVDQCCGVRHVLVASCLCQPAMAPNWGATSAGYKTSMMDARGCLKEEGGE